MKRRAPDPPSRRLSCAAYRQFTEWAQVESPPDPRFRRQAVIGDALYGFRGASGSFCIFVSWDFGSSWAFHGRLPTDIFDFEILSFQSRGKLWTVLLGGRQTDGDAVSEVWITADLKIFELVTLQAPWTPRYNLTCSVGWNGDFLLFGGYDKEGQFCQDLWRSSDQGATWKRVQHAKRFFRLQSLVCLGACMYAVENDHHYRLIKSTDGGTTWEVVNVRKRRFVIPCHLIYDPENSTLLCVSEKGLFKLSAKEQWILVNPEITATKPGGFQISRRNCFVLRWQILISYDSPGTSECLVYRANPDKARVSEDQLFVLEILNRLPLRLTRERLLPFLFPVI